MYIADFQASRTDPDASLMRSLGAGSRLGYHVHYGVDGGRARIIRTVLVTPYEVMENQVMLDLLWHTCFRWKVFPHQVTGDTKYGTIENIVALEEMGIRAYLPLPNYSLYGTLWIGPRVASRGTAGLLAGTTVGATPSQPGATPSELAPTPG